MFQAIYFAEEIIDILKVNAYRPYLEEKNDLSNIIHMLTGVILDSHQSDIKLSKLHWFSENKGNICNGIQL